MMMVNRENIANGETRIHDRFKKHLDSYTLTTPFDTAIVNDERIWHSVTPVIQLDTSRPAYRDVLVVTFSKK